jgi:hypothetical protein|tara:strand:- start:3280 stop:3549 length:270 start_codon:yes stop_codon:yes gene_type:complete
MSNDVFVKEYTRRDLTDGSTEKCLDIWIMSLEHQVKELQERVKYIKMYGERLIQQTLDSENEIREEAKKRGKEIMREREEAEKTGANHV